MKVTIISIEFIDEIFLRERFRHRSTGGNDGNGDRKGPFHKQTHLYPISFILKESWRKAPECIFMMFQHFFDRLNYAILWKLSLTMCWDP